MTAETSNAREWVDLLERAVPFLLDEGAKYDDDGSNEPLELAREIETLLASLPSDESALSSASLAFDGGREAATPQPPAEAKPVANGVVQRHVVTKFSDGSTRVEDVLTAPPPAAARGEPFAYVVCDGKDVTNCAELRWPGQLGKVPRGAKAAWRDLPPGTHPLYLAPPPPADAEVWRTMNAKTNGALPAHPVIGAPGAPEDYPGLTKRELFAAMAMQGILANRVYDPPRRNKLAGMAEDAVSAADALLAELAKGDNNVRQAG